MSKYIMALDQGTTSSRCILFDRNGCQLASAQAEFTQYFPNEGWVEHDPMDIWSTQFGVAAEALSKIGGNWKDVISVGITNQRETTIVWNRKTGTPIYPAIVWQCRRTAKLCEELEKKGYKNLIRSKTGLLPDPYFSATKIAWILEHVSGAREQAEMGNLCFGTVDTWLLWNLSGGQIHATDVSNASRTMLFNINTLEWDEDLLSLFRIPRSMLPEVKPTAGLFGYTDPSITGVPVPITGVAGDQQSALFGEGCMKAGMIKNTYGTGGFLLMNTGDKPIYSENGLITTVGWKIGQKVTYALEGSVFVCGSAVQWLRDSLGIISSAQETEQIAKSVPDTGGVYLVPAFTGLGAPYWDPDARGILVGITRGTGKAQLVRATLESMAYQTYDVIRLMEKATKTNINELRVDGGASANSFLLQFQSDILGIPVTRPSIIESTAFGAAAFAGIGCGLFSSPDDISNLVSDSARFTPAMSSESRDAKIQGWNKAVPRSFSK